MTGGRFGGMKGGEASDPVWRIAARLSFRGAVAREAAGLVPGGGGVGTRALELELELEPRSGIAPICP